MHGPAALSQVSGRVRSCSAFPTIPSVRASAFPEILSAIHATRRSAVVPPPRDRHWRSAAPALA
eukprot:430371-Rhodomonas_salina.2